MEQPGPGKDMEQPGSEKEMEQPGHGQMEGEEEELDWSKLFSPGMCPEGVEGMKDLDFSKLSGDWFLHRTDAPIINEMLPSCHHCQLEVDESGDFTATEEV